MKSQKELQIENKLLNALTGKTLELAKLLIHDKEVQFLQEYANTVAIKRLNFNDHGPVHMKKVSLNAIIMANLLHDAGIHLSLEADEVGTFDDSCVAVLFSAFFHDVGMSVGRQDHEHNSALLAMPIISRFLTELYKDNLEKQIILKSLAIEGIVGHMATQRIHSLEAGLILIADGCDMEKGRARIPMMLNTEPKVGDIHQYSAASIEHVRIEKGEKKPIRITVEMNQSVGFFQVEEVLFQKISMSPVKPFIELIAMVNGEEAKAYL